MIASDGVRPKKRLAIVATHPIQYYSPWFRHIASLGHVAIRVFYLWDYGVEARFDTGFRQPVQWDIPLLSGYDYEFVPNTSTRPGTHHFLGLRNPSLLHRVKQYDPHAVLVIGYNFAALLHLIFRWPRGGAPLLFRGDSHRLVKRGGAKEAVRRWLISAVYRRFAAILTVGSANHDYFRYHGVPEHKLWRAPHAVDNERFLADAAGSAEAAAAWRRELGIPEDERVILFAGKLERGKRPDDLLSAFLQLDLPRLSLLFVGSGTLEAELRASAAGHTHVFFAPFQNQSQMPRTYRAGDVFVLPSASENETWGLAVNEAMCMSLPVIVSDLVGCAQDLVRPHENGLVFRAGDVNALRDCLAVAFADGMRLKAWGLRSREIVEDYNYQRASAGLMAALTRLGVSAPAE